MSRCMACWRSLVAPVWRPPIAGVMGARGLYSAPEIAGQAATIRLSIAHEVSGLGSTRVVRFSVPKGSGDDGTGTVATGPENAEVQGRFEPLGAAGAVGNGRGGDSGGVGAAISALPAALRGRRAPRAAGQAPGQGLGQAGAGRRDRMDARRVPDRI